MLIEPELKKVLKRLKLSGMLATMPDRLAYARKEKLDYTQFLELILSDEVERRDHKHVTNRLRDAGFEEECTLERFDWSAKIRIDKARLTELPADPSAILRVPWSILSSKESYLRLPATQSYRNRHSPL